MSNFLKWKSSTLKYLSNLPGWCSKKKIIVFESDDWGSIRMPSRSAFQRLDQIGLISNNLETSRYNKFDTLASKEDFEGLFTTLASFKDGRGTSPVLTAVSLVANPDFEAIKETGFDEYHYEPFTTTLQRYEREEAFYYWKQGIKDKLFCPEFHGREHLNVMAWMRALQKGEQKTLMAFDNKFWGFRTSGGSYLAAFDLEYLSDLEVQKGIINSGLDLFEELHGKKSRFFVPPNGPFNNGLQETLSTKGIQYLSTPKIQREPQGEGKYRRRWHYLGQKNPMGITHLTRNCFFEPSAPGKDWVDSCLSDIRVAFIMCKPAVISSHRVNYIGGLEPSNRTNGLRQLKLLLQNIQHRWPEAIFLTSSQLGDLISCKRTIDELAK